MPDGTSVGTNRIQDHVAQRRRLQRWVVHQIECPKHNARFDIATGRALKRPATKDLSTFRARERDGRLEMYWPEAEQRVAG